MELTLERRYKCNGYTIGRLLIDGKYFCDTLEDADRGLDSNMSIEEIKRRKLKSITAIPTGRYRITLSVKSPKFGNKQFYHNVCRGKLPRLLDVKGFEGVLIHSGNTAKDTDGCVLCGENNVKGQVINSQDTFRKLYPILSAADKRGEQIWITVKQARRNPLNWKSTDKRLLIKNIERGDKMTHVVITVRKDGEEDAPAVRSKDYKDKADVCADVEDIMKFITNYIK